MLNVDQISISFPIDQNELSSIPIPSASQIQKDLQRESFIVNGTVFSGALGYGYGEQLPTRASYIRSSLVNACSSIVDQDTIDATVDRVIEMISRTRIGEYCYNELCMQ